MLLDSEVMIDVLRKLPPALAWFATLNSRPMTAEFCAIVLVSGGPIRTR